MCSPSVIASALAGLDRREALHLAAGLLAGAATPAAARDAGPTRTGGKRVLAAGKVLDLTHALSPTFPIWPGPKNIPIK